MQGTVAAADNELCLLIVMRIEPVAACAAAGIQASTLASASAAAPDFMARREVNIVESISARPAWREDAGIRSRLSRLIS